MDMAKAEQTVKHSRTQITVTALFESTQAVDQALVALVSAGVPRDLINVVVAQEAARRFYGGRARALRRETMRYAGIGGLVGLIIGILLGIGMVALPGFHDPGMMAFVQLLGPNLATVSGAIIGAAVGFFVHRTTEYRHSRAAESPESIVMAVTARNTDEANVLQQLMANNGGNAPRIEA